MKNEHLMGKYLILAGKCKPSQCFHEASKGWSPGGLLLGAVIVLLIVAYFKRK